MKKLLRRILLGVSLVLFLIAILSLWGIIEFRAAPSWYPSVTPAAKLDGLAQAAENKLIGVQNWAAAVRADAVRSGQTSPSQPHGPATRAAGEYEMVFRQDELNALFDKWSNVYDWNARIAAYVENPRIVLHDGRLIFAGKIEAFKTVVAFQFVPHIDADGKLLLDLVSVTGGRLSLPTALWQPYKVRVVNAIRRKLPQWREDARLSASGAANGGAIAAEMGQLLIDIADQRSADPVIFLPLADHGEAIPVRITSVKIADGELDMNVNSLSAAERSQLLQRIHAPLNDVAAQSK